MLPVASQRYLHHHQPGLPRTEMEEGSSITTGGEGRKGNHDTRVRASEERGKALTQMKMAR